MSLTDSTKTKNYSNKTDKNIKVDPKITMEEAIKLLKKRIRH